MKRAPDLASRLVAVGSRFVQRDLGQAKQAVGLDDDHPGEGLKPGAFHDLPLFGLDFLARRISSTVSLA
jgi:hypothetical protein